jgi:hypothetical protein
MTRLAWPRRPARPHSRATPFASRTTHRPPRSRDSAHSINRFETPARLGVRGPSPAHVVRDYHANLRPTRLSSPLRRSPAACNQPGAVQSLITSGPSLSAKRKRAKKRLHRFDHAGVCALRSDRPKRRTVTLRASVSSDRRAQDRLWQNLPDNGGRIPRTPGQHRSRPSPEYRDRGGSAVRRSRGAARKNPPRPWTAAGGSRICRQGARQGPIRRPMPIVSSAGAPECRLGGAGCARCVTGAER